MNKIKQNKGMVLVALLILLGAAGIFYALYSYYLKTEVPEQEPLVKTEAIPMEAAETAQPEEETAAVESDDTGIIDKPIDASANLHLDIRREKAENNTPEDTLSDRQIYFAGVGDETLSYDTEILLENLAENEDFMMKYMVTDMDSGLTVFETGLIPSGECVGWVPGHDLGEGEHHLNFHIAPYYPKGDEYLPLTSANNEVTFIIGGM